jgi:hypothetical protein
LSGQNCRTAYSCFRYSTALNSAAGGWLLLNPAIDVPNLVTLTGSQTLTNKSLTSPTLTGTPITPTATLGTNSTQIASTAFVAAAIAALSTVYQATSAVLTALAGIGTAVAGDVIYSSGAGVWARLAKGTASQALLMNAGATAPAWATLPFTKSFESSQQTISGAGLLTLPHSLGSKPKLCLVVLQCLTADSSYVTGDEVLLEPGYHGVNSSGIAVYPDATNINVRFGSNNMFLMRKDNGNSFTITNANWALVARGWA